MTTIVDPLGTPSIYYNKSGRTIVRMSATGDSLATAAPIPHESGDVVVVVDYSDGSNYWLVLPTSAEPGDTFAVFGLSGGIYVALPAGETLPNSGTEAPVQLSGGRIFYKASATEWFVTPY